MGSDRGAQDADDQSEEADQSYDDYGNRINDPDGSNMDNSDANLVNGKREFDLTNELGDSLNYLPPELQQFLLTPG